MKFLAWYTFGQCSRTIIISIHYFERIKKWNVKKLQLMKMKPPLMGRLIASNSVQEVMDTALIAQAVTLEARIPFIHFFDGFRTSHEVMKIEQLTKEDMMAMLDQNLIIEHRKRALSPDHPVMRGTAQNPDVYFQ